MYTRCRKFLSAFAISVFGTVLLFCASSFGHEPSIVTITEVSGTVTRDGVPLKAGDPIRRGDTIFCQGNSDAVLTWSNGSIVKLYPDTLLCMQGVSFDLETKMEKTFLRLEKGRVFAKAQVPEHMFKHFQLRVGNVPVIAQGSEFLLKYDETGNEFSVWSLIGTVLIDAEMNRIKVEEGQQVCVKAGEKPEVPVPMPDQTCAALMKTSKRIGGSLLIEEKSESIGGPLHVKIGGIRNRRGKPPYTVKCAAIVNGGSGKIKSIQWDFGDGQCAQGREAQHTFTQGVYGISVRVEDENGEKATGQITVSVEEDCAC